MDNIHTNQAVHPPYTQGYTVCMAGIERWLGPDGDYPAPEGDELVAKLVPGLVVVTRHEVPGLDIKQHVCLFASPDEVTVIEFGQIVDEDGCCLVCGEDLNDF